MYAVIRRYRVRLGTVASAAQLAETNLLPRMNHLPGFVAYYLLDAGEGILASISICATAEGADAAGALAAEWFRSDWPSFQLIPPEVTDGEVLVHAEVGRATGRRRSERRSARDRRVVADRRVTGERRRAAGSPPPDVERRAVGDRRVTGERRASAERRTAWDVVETVRPPLRLGVAPQWRRSRMG
jgi:hypothetical protein